MSQTIPDSYTVILDLLNEVADFLEDYADADGGPDGYRPNKAMSLGLRVEEEIARLVASPSSSGPVEQDRVTRSESGALPPGVASMIANQQEPDADLRRAAAIAADRSGDKKDELDTPLCDGHADAWFTGRNHLPGDTRCVVCAFTPSHVAPVGDWAIGQNVRGLLERIKLHFQRGDPHDARYSTLSAEDKAAAFVADAERASREGDLLYFEICTLLQRQSIAPSASERGRDDALVERIWELLWEHCRVVFYPQNNEYPIEHAPHARKEARLAIIAALTKLAVVPPESTVTRNAADSRVKP
jgi:hypothetical protein